MPRFLQTACMVRLVQGRSQRSTKFATQLIQTREVVNQRNIALSFRAIHLGKARMTASDDKYRILACDYEKPEIDDRKYRYIKLPNKLRAFLIQDEETDKAAAALDVNVGSFEDPEELPGLAHFCEHLLFMGNEKYPNENEYSSFLSKHGGSSNAYTASQNTNYYFQVNHDNLYAALDRFSGFFSCPLFNESSTNKEINAVDSENKKNLQNDLWRLYQLQKSLVNPEHPYNKFSTGNLETLHDGPKAKGINAREELLKFHKKYYSANLMKLVVFAREDLDTLSDWVAELFSDVANTDAAVPEYSVPMLTPEYLTQIIKAKPVKELKKVEVMFSVPDVDENWDSRPSHYLSHLIGHEGKNSLLAFLKKKRWATELSAGAQTVAKGNAYFCVDIDLTDEGIQNYQEVVYALFQYLDMLRASLPQEWVFKELNEIGIANFKFKQKGNPSSTVSSLAKILHKSYIPPKFVLNSTLMRKFEPSLIMEYLSQMIPQRSKITVISRQFETNMAERWYGTQYAVENYPPEFMDNICSPVPNPELSLPFPNEFVATKFEVEKQDNVVPAAEPVLLKDNNFSRLWYRKDDRFWVPKGYVYVSMKLPLTYASIFSSMLSSLYIDMVNHDLKDLAYNAECAGLVVSFVKTNQGFDLTLSGYDDKLEVLLTRFLEGLRSFAPSKGDFEVIKKKLCQKLHNSLYDAPYLQARGVFGEVINERSWPTPDKLHVTEQLTYEDLINFIPSVYRLLNIETLVHGNFKVEHALKLDGHIRNLSPTSIKSLGLENCRLRSYLLPEGKSYSYNFILPDEKNTNSCVQKIIQLGPYSEVFSAKASLLAQLIDEPCFNILRTEEQLGYIVFSSKLNAHGTTNLRILVQSERDTTYLESRIDNFLNLFEQRLTNMTEDEFEKHKKALCNTLLQKFKNMGEENLCLVSTIYLGDYNFRGKERKAEIVKKLTRQEMIQFFKDGIMSEKASKLTLHLRAKNSTSSGSPVSDESDIISNLVEFKRHLYLAPSRRAVKEFKAASTSV